MNGSDIIEKASDRVVNRLAAIPGGAHAVLFYGSSGVDKGVLAERLALSWMCPSNEGSGSCGSCSVCRSFGSGNLVDLLRVSPGGNSRIIKVNTIAGSDSDGTLPVLEFLRTRPLQARHKVVIIEDADRMNASAANALLKTLEEPGVHAKFILTTNHIGGILSTIASRCLSIACASPSVGQLEEQVGQIEEFERIFSEQSSARVQLIRQCREGFQRLFAFFESLSMLGYGSALKAAETFRMITESIDEKLYDGARTRNAEVLRAFALWLADRHPSEIRVRQAVAEAHRRVIGNGSFAYQTDPLFCLFLRDR